jgi:hypothetical protein
MENKINMNNYVKMIIISAMLVLIGQWVGKGINPIEALPGIIIISIVVVLGLFLKHIIPFNFPAFAWVTLLALVFSLPSTPGSDIFMAYTNKVDFLATTTPILAFAGVSVGNKIDLLKKLSWKLVIIAMIVFTSTFFGSALVSQVVLSMQGKI